MLAPATLAALPSTRAIPDRDVFYVADPSAPFRVIRIKRSPQVISAAKTVCARSRDHGSRLRIHNSLTTITDAGATADVAGALDVEVAASHYRSSERTGRRRCSRQGFPRSVTRLAAADIRRRLAGLPGLRSRRRRQLMFAGCSFHPRRLRCSVSRRFPAWQGSVSHSHGLARAGSRAVDPEYKWCSQAATQSLATPRDDSSKTLVQRHTQLALHWA